MFKKKIWFLAILMFTLLLAGCSNTNSTSDNKSGGKGESPNQEVKKEIVYAQSISITSLDIAGMQPQGYPAGYEAAFAIFDGLVQFDENLGFQPNLAKEWSVGEDGVTWTFKLKEGVKFHDGTDFNADSVVFAFERMIDPDINVGAYSLWNKIDRTEKVDDYTVNVITKQPYGGLLNVIAHGSALIPSPKAVEELGEDFSLKPVGTGPYKLEKFEPGTELVVVKNEEYFNGTPRYDKITFRFVGDASARIAALKSGQADVIDAVPVEFAEDLKATPNLEVIEKPGLQVFGIGLNQTNEFLKDKKVRQALNYGINKKAIIEVLFKGHGTTLTSPLAPNTTGSVESGEFAFDVNKAKELLADAGWEAGSDGVLEKGGKRLTLNLRTPEGAYPNDVLVAETIQDQLKDLGVEVEIEKVESSTFWDGLKQPEGKAGFDMVLWGYNPSHGDGYIHLDAMFKTNPDAGAVPPQWNHIWYSNSEVDQLLDSASQTVDMEERTKVLGQAQAIIWDESPYIWLYAKNIISAKNKNIDGVEVLPVVFTLVDK